MALIPLRWLRQKGINNMLGILNHVEIFCTVIPTPKVLDTLRGSPLQEGICEFPLELCSASLVPLVETEEAKKWLQKEPGSCYYITA